MDKQNIRIHLRAYDNKILDLSTVEIVNASPRIIIIKDNISVWSFNNKLKKPKSGLIDGSIENETIPIKPIKKTIGTIIKKEIIKPLFKVW